MNLRPYLSLLRPHQWLKNLMLFFPAFLSGSLVHGVTWPKAGLAMGAFCCASSAIYLLNDVLDLQSDASHPQKSKRPLPSGRVSVRSALIMSAVLGVSSVVFSLRVSALFLLCTILYLFVFILYSFVLKHLPVVDIFCIAFGFVIRLYGGGAAFHVQISEWLFLTVFLLAIFLSVGKRFSERMIMGAEVAAHRKSLAIYPDGFLESAMYLSGAAVLVTYSIYAIATPLMVFTVPLCLYGLLRYLLLIKLGKSGDPTDSLIKDLPLLLTAIAWAIWVGVSVYR